MNIVSLEQNLGLKLFIQILLHIYVKEVKSYHSEFKNQFIVITDKKFTKHLRAETLNHAILYFLDVWFCSSLNSSKWTGTSLYSGFEVNHIIVSI